MTVATFPFYIEAGVVEINAGRTKPTLQARADFCRWVMRAVAGALKRGMLQLSP